MVGQPDGQTRPLIEMRTAESHLESNKADRRISRVRNFVSHHAGPSVGPEMQKSSVTDRPTVEQTNRQTDRQMGLTDGPTDTATYRVACTRLNTSMDDHEIAR